MPDLTPGAIFAGHRIEGVAGRGGMGVVYRATHLALDHVVALKVISPNLAGDPRFRRRFADESRIAVSLRHPNVVQIHHAGEEQQLLFVTMDLIEGTDLRGLLNREGELAPERAVPVIAQVAAALDVAHSRGLVHRDIKPGNVLIEERPGEEHAYLTDFGLARHIEASTGVTATGAFVGTLDYVAPEQIKGERVDARSDVYALGCVLFELLTGNPPFAAREDKVAKMYAHLQEEPPSLRVLRPDLPGEFDHVIKRALAKDPAARFPSAGDLARAAEAAIAGQPTVESERSVGVGPAAPGPPEATTAADRPAHTPTVHAPTAETEAKITAAEPAVPDAPPPVPARRAMWRLAAAAAAAVVVAVVAVVVLSSGDGDGGEAPPSAGTGEETTASNDRGGQGAPEAKVIGSVEVGGLPVALVHGDRGVWVGNRSMGEVTFIDPSSDGESNEGSFRVGAGAEGVAAASGFVYTAAGDEGAVVRFKESEPNGERQSVDGFTKPQGLAFGAGRIWVADYGADQLVGLGPTTLREDPPVTVGDGPYGVAVGEDAVWVTNRLDGSVTKVPLDGGNPASKQVGAAPKGIAVAEDGSVWVAVTGENKVRMLNGDGEIVETVDVPPEPRGVVAAFGSVWVSTNAGAVVRIDPTTAKEVEQITLEEGLESITAGPESIWVANGGDGTVTRIDPDA